jgi:hypothetical protein
MRLAFISISTAVASAAFFLSAPAECCKANCKTAWGETQTIQQAVASYQMDYDGANPCSMATLVRERYLSKEPVDPWGRPFELRCPGTHNPEGCDVRSPGRNGIFGDCDDINSWQTEMANCKECAAPSPNYRMVVSLLLVAMVVRLLANAAVLLVVRFGLIRLDVRK